MSDGLIPDTEENKALAMKFMFAWIIFCIGCLLFFKAKECAMENNTIVVGTVAELKRECLGNPPGTPGICYEVYTLDNRPGYSFIFENGNYDGFSPDEVEMLLDVRFRFEIEYKFVNVGRLSQDFPNLFAPLLKTWKMNKGSLESLKTFNCSLSGFRGRR